MKYIYKETILGSTNYVITKSGYYRFHVIGKGGDGGAGGERVGDIVIVETYGGGRLRGIIEKLSFDLTGGYLATARVIGKPIEISTGDYMPEIFMGDNIGVI